MYKSRSSKNIVKIIWNFIREKLININLISRICFQPLKISFEFPRQKTLKQFFKYLIFPAKNDISANIWIFMPKIARIAPIDLFWRENSKILIVNKIRFNETFWRIFIHCNLYTNEPEIIKLLKPRVNFKLSNGLDKFPLLLCAHIE